MVRSVLIIFALLLIACNLVLEIISRQRLFMLQVLFLVGRKSSRLDIVCFHSNSLFAASLARLSSVSILYYTRTSKNRSHLACMCFFCLKFKNGLCSSAKLQRGGFLEQDVYAGSRLSQPPSRFNLGVFFHAHLPLGQMCGVHSTRRPDVMTAPLWSSGTLKGSSLRLASA